MEIWLEHALGATQREAHIVAVLFAFTGQIASCCHFIAPFYKTRIIVTVFSRYVKVLGRQKPCIMIGMDISYLFIVLGVILISMTLHEVMHGFVSYWLGDDTAKLQGRLTLNPVKHIDPVLTIMLPLILAAIGAPIFGGAKPVPFNPARLRHEEWGVALVAVAGPMVNFLLSFSIFGIFVLAGMPSEGLLSQILITGIWVNLGFFVFNMLPIPPLDGSRVVYAFAPDFVRQGMEAVERLGLIVIFAIVFLASSFIGQILLGTINAILAVIMTIYGVG